MKKITLIVLMVMSVMSVSAQRRTPATHSSPPIRNKKVVTAKSVSPPEAKHHLFADVSIPLRSPGFSITYNYNMVKHIGVGIGVQDYYYYPTIANDRQFSPAVYGELRFNIWPDRKNQFFGIIDFGIDFYKHDDDFFVSHDHLFRLRSNSGYYTGLGLGYIRRITKRGGGPYASLKIISNSCKMDRYDPYTLQPVSIWLGIYGDLALSVGFKF